MVPPNNRGNLYTACLVEPNLQVLFNLPDMVGAYTADGWGGQYITVIPKRKLVVAHKAKLSTLTLWGLTQGGVGDWQYWEILKMLLS